MKRFHLLICVILVGYLVSCQPYSDNGSIKLTPKIFKDSISKTNTQIIDVRKLEEFREGHIGQALNINYLSEKFEDSLSLLNSKKPVFIYCRSGKRSAKSISIFKSLGFKKIYELDGGILNWKKEAFVMISN